MAKLNKLHRSINSSVIAGVCGGIAEYFGWSPVVLRIVILLVIAISAGITLAGFIPVYIVMWILMPKATPASYE
ncbi:MAG: PspC domain-containing protein [Moraxellaceae bacterium]|nr:PspC domain-containing protein [Moraxellaceae bacterium]